MKTYGGSAGKDPRILSLGINMSSQSSGPDRFTPEEIAPYIHFRGVQDQIRTKHNLNTNLQPQLYDQPVRVWSSVAALHILFTCSDNLQFRPDTRSVTACLLFCMGAKLGLWQ
jgi:hypothetical protein